MIIKFEPIALSKVWGGTKLSALYNCKEKKVGEIWGISAHKTFSNIISNREFQGMSLRDLFRARKEFFGYYPEEEFPILIKLIEADGDLSIQVHPDDKYAKIHENSFGKDECWFILNTESEDTKIVIGHSAKTKNQFLEALHKGNIENLLSYQPVKKGDYFYIPSGKVHAICKNTMLLEVSQSSDVTYRLYDYNRLDNGKLRELHIDKSLDVITFPDTPNQKTHNPKIFDFKVLDANDNKITADLHGDYIYIIEGSGEIDDTIVNQGDFIMITSANEYKIIGKLKYVLVRITK